MQNANVSLVKKVAHFSNLVATYKEEDRERYKSYLQSFSELILSSGYSFKVSVHIRSRECTNCHCFTLQRKVHISRVMPCTHYICSVDCLKAQLVLYNGLGFDLGSAVCSEPTCGQVISQQTIYKFFKSPQSYHLWADSLVYAQLPSFTCDLCLESYKIVDSITLDCDHRYCASCLKTMLELSIREKRVDNESICCPHCQAVIDHNILKAVISPEEWLRYERFMLDDWKPEDEDDIDFKCPGLDCTYRVLVDKELDKVQCPKCAFTACPLCALEFHEGLTCEVYKQWKEENEVGEQRLDDVAEAQGWKKCPHCGAWCEKTEGCMFMTCESARCKGKNNFCYICGSALTVFAR